MSSKKHRKSIRARYEREAKSEFVKEVTSSSVNLKDQKLRKLMEQIETLMKGENKFIIFLTKPTQGKFAGAYAQAGNYNSENEVYPHCDEIYFYQNNNGKGLDYIGVRYIRVYSDFPSSISEFTLDEIRKVEEVLPEKIFSDDENLEIYGATKIVRSSVSVALLAHNGNPQIIQNLQKGSEINSLIENQDWIKLFSNKSWLNALETASNLNSFHEGHLKKELLTISKFFPEETKECIIPELIF